MAFMIKLGASAAASEFCEWVQIGINAYIAHCKYQVKPHFFSFVSTKQIL